MPIQTIKLLISAAVQAPSPDNSQPCHFTWDGKYLTLSYDYERVGGTTFAPDNPATLLSVGAIIENLLQAADHLGVNIELQELSENEIKSGSYYKIRLSQYDLSSPSQNLHSHPIFRRHTNRFSFNNRKLTDELSGWIAQEQEQSAHTRVIVTREGIREIADLVRIASEIRFQTREVHEWLGNSLRFSLDEVNRGDGLDIQTLDLPPGGGMFLKFIAEWRRMSFLNKFRAYKLLSIIDSAPVGKAHALVSISSPLENQQIIAAGRLLTRVWIRLNEEGVAVHPYYVIPDQLVRIQQKQVPENLLSQALELAHRTDETFGLDTGSEQLRMVLRVGYPRKKPKRSKRLPLERVFTDSS